MKRLSRALFDVRGRASAFAAAAGVLLASGCDGHAGALALRRSPARALAPAKRGVEERCRSSADAAWARYLALAARAPLEAVAASYVDAIRSSPAEGRQEEHAQAERSRDVRVDVEAERIAPAVVQPAVGANVRADDPHAYPYTALALPVRVTATGRDAIAFDAHHELHGGAWPPNDVHLCVRRAPVLHSWCQPAFRTPERADASRPTTLVAGRSVVMPLRTDWRGTGSMHAEPLMAADEAAAYDVVAIVFFRAHGERAYATSAQRTVSVVIEGARSSP